MYITLDDIDSDSVDKAELITAARNAEDANDDEALARIDKAIAYAENLLNDALRKSGEAVPTAVTPVVKALCCDIAAYRVLSRRSGGASETQVKKYDDAMKKIEDIAKHGIAVQSDAEQSETAEITTWTRSAAYTNDVLNRMPK